MIAQRLVRRSRVVLNLLAVTFACSAAVEVFAQQTGGTAEDEGYIAVLTADKVYVRSGAANSYYPFGMLREGDLVKVLEEKYNWARVATVGPAFKDMFGYIKQAKGEAPVIRIPSDNPVVTTLGQINLIAPNLETGNAPQHSWKPIVNMPPDRQVTLLQTIETDTQTIYAVSLPKDASGWVSMAHVRRADSAEQKKWEDSLRAPQTPANENKTITNQTPTNQQPANQQAIRPQPQQNPRPVTETPVQSPSVNTANPTTTPVENSANQSQPSEFSMQPPQQNETTLATSTSNEETLAESTAGEIVPEKGAAEIAKPGPPKTPKERLEALEGALERLRKEPIETAEVDELQRLYKDLAEDAPNDVRINSFSNARAEQLEIWRELQKKKQELAALDARINSAGDDVQSVRYTLLTSGNYTAVGRIASSTVYDGSRLPKLFRVQDPGTGRTVAYIRPEKEHDLAGLLDQLVGIMGERDYDGSLGLHIIDPERIDLLAAHKDQRTPQDQRTTQAQEQ